MDSDNDNYDWDWGTDDELEMAFVRAQEHDQIASSSGSSSSTPIGVAEFTAMGFPKEMVIKVLLEKGENDDEDAILNALLTHTELATFDGQDPGPSRLFTSSQYDHEYALTDDESDADEKALVTFADQDPGPSRPFTSAHNDFTYALTDAEDKKGCIKNSVDKDQTISLLFEMGYRCEDALHAVEICGVGASIEELSDFIVATEVAKIDAELTEQPHKEKRRKYVEVSRKQPLKRPRCNDNISCTPNRMIGYGVPGCMAHVSSRKIQKDVLGPPFFYYENVALAPIGAWETVSRFLFDIKPEFVDSIHFSAAARKRGYIHNLPIENRQPLLPIPPQTIHEALPVTKKWWPSWDKRTKLNCLLTCIGSAQLIDRIRRRVEPHEGVPPLIDQKFVIEQCKRWNLVWVGKYKVAVLEPEEMEVLLGFPKCHTRGLSRTDRYKVLGNTFQIDTVAYHFSVLKPLFPQGMNVLSLFSGIGGAEVALHRLGIPLKNVVSVEISPVCHQVLKDWWEESGQTGNLIHVKDVQKVDIGMVHNWICMFGGFDLVVGGSPCNNLSGGNRRTRDGLEGEHSSLFYHYHRILELVRLFMKDR